MGDEQDHAVCWLSAPLVHYPDPNEGNPAWIERAYTEGGARSLELDDLRDDDKVHELDDSSNNYFELGGSS